MINAKPRFGLEDDNLFDYKTNRYIKVFPGLRIDDRGGWWDGEKVAELIREGKSIESAWTASKAEEVTTVEQANIDFTKTIDAVIEVQGDSVALPSDGVALNSMSHPEPNQLMNDAPAMVSADSVEDVEIDLQDQQ